MSHAVSSQLWRQNLQTLARHYEAAATGAGLYSWIIQAHGPCAEVKRALNGPAEMETWKAGGKVRHYCICSPSDALPSDKPQFGFVSRLCGEGDAARFLSLADATMQTFDDWPVSVRQKLCSTGLMRGAITHSGYGWITCLHVLAWSKMSGLAVTADRMVWNGFGSYVHETMGRTVGWPQPWKPFHLPTSTLHLKDAFYSVLGHRYAPLNVFLASTQVISLILDAPTTASDAKADQDAAADGKGEQAGDDEPLSDCKQALIRSMYALEAFNSDSRMTADDIVNNISRYKFSENHKRPLAQLVSTGFAKSKPYKGGGYWLTAKGKARAESMRA